ncbi:hypothetical protein RFI_20530, partial [Reticulomyxa filosa]
MRDHVLSALKCNQEGYSHHFFYSFFIRTFFFFWEKNDQKFHYTYKQKKLSSTSVTFFFFFDTIGTRRSKQINKQTKCGDTQLINQSPKKKKKKQTEYAWNDKEPEANSLNCGGGTQLRIAAPDTFDSLDVIWSYALAFEVFKTIQIILKHSNIFKQESDVQWASRWDAYLKMQDPQIHWFSILNSFMIVIFLSAM